MLCTFLRKLNLFTISKYDPLCLDYAPSVLFFCGFLVVMYHLFHEMMLTIPGSCCFNVLTRHTHTHKGGVSCVSYFLNNSLAWEILQSGNWHTLSNFLSL